MLETKNTPTAPSAAPIPITADAIIQARPLRKQNRTKSNASSGGGMGPQKRTTNTKAKSAVDPDMSNSAAEKRRAQLRVGQRAFRQRRENTIETLRAQVLKLQTALADVEVWANTVVTERRDDGAFLELRGILSRAQDATKTYEADGTMPTTIPETTITDRHQETCIASTPVSSSSHSVDNLVDPSTVPTWQSSDGTALDTAMIDRAHLEPGPLTTYNFMPSSFSLPDFMPSTFSLPDFMPTSFSLPNFMPTSFSLPASLRPISTLSFEPRSFGQRLYRRCLEVCFQLLSFPWRAPRTIQSRFRVPHANGKDNNYLLRRFAELLQCAPDELAELCGRSFGQSTSEVLASETISSQSSSDLEETWLNPMEVERYLDMQGIDVNSSAWYVSGKVASELLQPQSQCSTKDSLQSGSDARGSAVEQLEPFFIELVDEEAPMFAVTDSGEHPSVEELGPGSYAVLGSETLPPSSGIGLNPRLDDPSASVSAYLNGPIPPGEQQNRLSSTLEPPTLVDVTVDLVFLIRSLILSGHVLDKHPGFRKEDIDTALRASCFVHN